MIDFTGRGVHGPGDVSHFNKNSHDVTPPAVQYVTPQKVIAHTEREDLVPKEKLLKLSQQLEKQASLVRRLKLQLEDEIRVVAALKKIQGQTQSPEVAKLNSHTAVMRE